MSQPRELVMSISLNALEHLGINLYSNILLSSLRSLLTHGTQTQKT